IEEQRSVYIRQLNGTGAGATWAKVADQNGAGAVGLPQFSAINSIIGGEEQRSIDVGQEIGTGIQGAGTNVGHLDRAGGRSIGFPQFRASGAIIGRKE